MLSSEVSYESKFRLSVSDNPVKRNLYVLDKSQTFGSRLIEAFGTDDKNFIAEKLGFTSVQGVYKVISGDRELDFDKLKKFRDYTKCSIDWLLTGEGPKRADGSRAFDLEASIERHGTWRPVLDEWFDFEGKYLPEFEGASLMYGWDGLSPEMRVAAIRDLKKILDAHAEPKEAK